ncbi:MULTISPECIES: glycine zipper 2TM domain-containing protein [Gammaproteobacteria]|jgi:outer membrane lipoprotein SlyB|uniref:Glycine zipper 2TM domain-containing protein n=4 Tax=Gammaproteobacteria TaxID=1236 RepID=A0A498CSH2_9GAMM|nr:MULTISPECIES: glycine zipper 2TM domain-containing protein [Stenotrophomonas]MBU2048436.1 glycine zipper 2TM domain-containing protein [Gammaproteobacteria bacterium]AOX61226.1 peptidoglycan-associated outer membrane lipoprotein precursor [Stenotrophomonas sp. LM091]KAB7630372.1 glycine zipper 2TM domain-containing protein [Stenotrophomonas rhizophila]MBW8372992.1 glycine zipper 2TM domain-containing protein [Stenotrophomonas sp.]MCS4280988.1 outer membrane lipoprotein SlyB [Stenotrophomona
MKIQLIAAAAVATVALAGCATTSPGYGSSGYNNGYGNSGGNYNTNRCADCGIVTRINQVASGRSAPSATGAVLGGIVGAVAGHEISDHTGGSRGNKNIAAAAGAVGGALAGNQIQKNVTSDTFDITVRMDDGRTVVVNQRDLGGIRENTYVRVVNGKVILR